MLCRLIPLLALTLAACDGRVFVRDGVTDGDRFTLSDRALSDSDPVLQSWVTYSLAKSACQLDSRAPNPARHSSYGCEFMARSLLLDTWEEKKAENPALADPYLDTLYGIWQAGWLDEYVVHYFRRPHWQVPVEVNVEGFGHWRQQHLRGHRPVTRIIGSWSFAKPAGTIARGEQ